MIAKILRTSVLRASVWPIVLFCTTAYFITSCKQQRGIESYIPGNASAIITINTSNIVTKLLFNNFEGIDLRSFVNISALFLLDNEQETDSPIKAFFSEPTASGLNLLDNIYLYISDIENKKKYHSGIFWEMSNAKKFEEFLNTKIAEKYALEITEKGNYKIGHFKGYDFVFGWNKQVLVAMFSNKPGIEHAISKTESIFEMDPNESISNDANFLKLKDTDDDITVFAKPEKLKPFTEKLIPDTFNGGIDYFNAHINFDEEEVKVNIQQYLQEDAIDLYQDLLTENLNSNLCDEIDDSELVAFLNFKYDKGFMAKFIKFYKMRLALKAVIAATGVNEKELYELTEGDVFIAYARNNQNHYYELPQSDTDKKVKLPCFVAEVKTGPKMPAFLDNMTKNGILNKEEGIYNMKEILGYDTFIKMNDDSKMLVTNDSAFISKKKRRIIPEPDSEIQKLSEGYPVSAYFNFDRFMKEASEMEKQRFLNQNFFEVANLLKTASFYTKPLEDNVMKSRLEIHFKERDENSLNSLIKLLTLLEKNRINTSS